MAESIGADCALGMPIAGTTVDKSSANIGGYAIQDSIKKYGYELKLMVMPTQPRVESQDPEVGRLAQYLWQQRVDYSEQTLHSSNLKVLKAA